VPYLTDDMRGLPVVTKGRITPASCWLAVWAHLLLAFTTIATSAQAQVPVGSWTFDEGFGTAAADSSGHGHTATMVNGVRWVTGPAGGAVSADAASQQYVSIPALDLSDSTAVTVTVWVNRTYSTGGGHVLFEATADHRRSTDGFTFLPDDDTCHGIQAALQGNAGRAANCYSQPSSGVWHHFAVVFDKRQTAGDQVRVFIDGVLQVPSRSLLAATGADNFGGNPIYVFSRGGKTMFDSSAVADFRVYNAALTAAQVQQIYRGGTLVSLAVLPASASISAGSQQQFLATGTYADGSQRDLTNSVIWTSATSSIANIIAGGVASGVATGSTGVKASLGSLNASAGLQVTPASGLDSLVLTGWQQGFDFRKTATYVTDPSGDTHVLPTTAYPTKANGVTFGWVNTSLVQGRNRSTSVDPRLAGINFATNGTPATFYVDLPSAGTYNLSLALGDARWPECTVQCEVQFLDGSTVLATVTGGPENLGYFYDATGKNWSVAQWPTNNLTQQVTLTGTRLTMVVGTSKATGDFTTVAFLGVAQTNPPTFTISASPSSLSIQQGNQGTSTITTTISGGFNSAITLSASGMPSGTTVSFNPNPIPAPGSGSSTMTITVGASTPTGTYPITVTGNGGGIQQNTTVTLTVTAPPNFTMSASPASLSVQQGNQGTSTITTAVSGGFNNAITLSASGMPSGTTVSFNPNPIPAPGSGSSTMTITVGSGTPTGTYPITVTGNGGGIQRNATVTLTVTASPNFTMSASPASLSVQQGNQGTSTITTTISGGFNSAITLSASGIPSGTTVSFNPNPIPAPGSGSSTMTITVGSGTPTGTYPITVTGNGGGTQHNATVTLTVTAVVTTISYVQGNYTTPQTPQSTVTVTFSSAQIAGDLNVVVVGWNDSTAVVSTVTDTKGNAYTRAVGPTIFSGYLSQSIYYAKNIAAAAAGANTVTVTFNSAANNPDIRILEYSGADPNNPVDVTAANTGNSASTSSGSAITTNPTDLIFGANIVLTLTTGPGNGFTSRILTSPDGDIAEDEMVAATGSYSATAPLNTSGQWIMQMVAFRTPVAGNFTLSASPASLSVQQGNQGTSTITTAISGSFNSAITLSASGVPSGTTVSFNPDPIPAPGSGSSTMTISVGSSTAAGTYPITVTGNGGGIQQTATVTLTVTAQGSFTVSAAPASLSIPQGNQGTSTITTTLSGGFNGAITLSASGMPSGTTVSFNPNPIPAPGSGNSTMTIIVGGSTPVGTYPITVTGNGGGIQQNLAVTLTVLSDPDFTISASPGSLSVVRGNQGTSTITTTVIGSFNSSISLSASGMPSGTTVSFNPSTIPAPGSGSSTMTITVGSSTETGTYLITVTGNGGGDQHTVTVTLTVVAQVSLSWTASTSPGIAGYNVYRSTTSGGPYTKLNSSLITTTNYNDQTVQSGFTYYYVATAVNSQGLESAYSNQAAASVQ
jgi:uncharacterized membrane protein